MKSDKPIKDITNLMGKKTFFFPHELSNERVGNDHKQCILVRVNGKSFYILTGENVELSLQEYSVLRDSGMITNGYSYEKVPDFDPIRRYENKIL